MVDHPPKASNWVHEIKYDGYRLQVHCKNQNVKLFTRNANDWSEQFSGIVKAFENLPIQNAIFDGEAVVLDNEGKSDFAKLQEALSTKANSQIKIFIFDLLYLNDEDLRSMSLKMRKDKLKKILPHSSPILFYSEDVIEFGLEFFKLACQYELEGIVSKDSTAPYRSGRSSIWCKSKCTTRQEFVIGGFTEGTGNRKNELGALLLGVYEKVGTHNKFRYVGKVGTGFTFKALREVKIKIARLERKKTYFDINSPKGKNIHWLKPKLVAEINFSNWTKDQSLRNPVFIGFRNDKKKEDIVMEKVTHIIKNDLLLDVPEKVTLSHPEKILFEKEKITKKIIADYYQKVSSFMLPHVNDRPLSLVRCPSGADKKCFYQKHPGAGDVSEFFKTFKVKEKSDTTNYIALISALGLRQLVQMNAFEIHTWNSHYQTLMHPDQIVLDFDPAPDVSYKAVVKACFDMKKILMQLKLISFVKVGTHNKFR